MVVIKHLEHKEGIAVQFNSKPKPMVPNKGGEELERDDPTNQKDVDDLNELGKKGAV